MLAPTAVATEPNRGACGPTNPLGCWGSGASGDESLPAGDAKSIDERLEQRQGWLKLCSV